MIMAEEEKEDTHIAIFRGKAIRRKWFNDEWWFVATDIVSALTDSKDPNGYLKDMRRRDEGFNVSRERKSGDRLILKSFLPGLPPIFGRPSCLVFYNTRLF